MIEKYLSIIGERKGRKRFSEMAAYNSAWDQYKKPEDRYGDDSREEVAHKVAWVAVKQNMKKKTSGNPRAELQRTYKESIYTGAINL